MMKYYRNYSNGLGKPIALFISILILFTIIITPVFGNISSITNTIASCSLSSAGSRTVTRGSSYYIKELNYSIHGGSLAGGVDYGNFDNDSYQEMLVVGGSSEGRLNLIEYNLVDNDFESHLLWWDPNGALVDVAVGELNETLSGPEILVGGFSGNLTLLNYNGVTAANQTIWSSKNYTSIFGLAIGELDGTVGNEIAIADGSNLEVYILTFNNGSWSEITVEVDDPPRNVFIGDFDQNHLGNELLVTCINGTVYRVTYETNQWSAFEIFRDSQAALSVVIDDLNATHPGSEVVLASLSWNVTLLWGSGTNWYNKTVWHASGALEGIAYGDFDHLHEGKELCITGYSNTAIMLYETEASWYNEIIFYDPNPLQTELNGALIADFYPHNSGDELIINGFTGTIWMLVFRPPDFNLSSPFNYKTTTPGKFTTFFINLEKYSEYNLSVTLTLKNMPPNTTYALVRIRAR